jgi:hypothetical protein
MSYATIDELASALRVRVTAQNTDDLQRCLDAATREIDAWLDRPTGDPVPPDAESQALAASVNIARGLEWFKANDAAFGAIGFADSGVLRVPGDTFARHAAILIPLKVQYGIA